MQLNGRKRRALAAYLVVHRGTPAPVERIVDALWDGHPSAGAEATVRTYVSQLRRRFADERLELGWRHGGYVLDVDPDCVDVAHFESAVAAALAEPSAAGRLRHTEEALGLWRGTPLDEFAGAAWADDAARHWIRLRLLALERQIDALLDIGRPSDALVLVESAVGEHPLHEPLWIALMLARYQCGRQADALRAAREARQILATELGIEPGPELVELEQRILVQDPLVDPATHAFDGSQRSEPRSAIRHREPSTPEPTQQIDVAATMPIIGRDREIAIVRHALDQARSGRGKIVLISGEPGIGKSRVLQELNEIAREAGMATLCGRCFETDAAPAYLPWIEVARSAIATDGGDTLARLGPQGAELARLVPELVGATSGVGETGDGAQAQWWLFESFLDFLDGVASGRPVVVRLEDIHWADNSSLKLLEHVAARLDARHLLVAATFREAPTDRGESLDSTLGRLARLEPVWLNLARLDDEAIARLVDCVAAPKAATRAEIVRRSDGNPFFAKELAQLGIDDVIPATLRAAVTTRIRLLDPGSADVLQGAALLGGEIDIGVVAAVMDCDVEMVAAALDDATRAGLVDYAGQTPRFVHALVREALADTTASSRRWAVHERAARVLSHLPERLDEAAQHWLHALRTETATDALDTTLRAAERAHSLLAFDEEAAHYANALRIFESQPVQDPPRRVDLLQAHGDAAARAGHIRTARDAFRAAIDIAITTHDAGRAARAAISFHGPARPEWRDEEAALLNEVLAMAGDCDLAVRAQLHAQLARANARPSQDAQHALDLARQSGDPRAIAVAWLAIFWSSSVHDTAVLQQAAGASYQAARAAGDAELEIEALMLRYIVGWQTGDRTAAAEARARHTLLARRLGQPFYRAVDIAIDARELVAAGNLTRAEEHDTSIEELSDDPLVLGYYVRLGQIRRWQCRTNELPWDDAARIIDEGSGYGATFWLARGLHHADAGDRDEAHACLTRAWHDEFALLTIGDTTTNAHDFAFFADLCAAVSEPEYAHVLLDWLGGWCGLHAQITYALYLGPFALYIGMLERVVDDLDAAAVSLSRAITEADSVGSPPFVARAQVELARVKLQTGHLDEAKQLIEQACTIASQLGLSFIDRCADQLDVT